MLPAADARIIPNPNGGDFTIAGNINTELKDEATIVITDMLGKVVYRSTAPIANGKINTAIHLGNVLASGQYLLAVQTSKSVKMFHVTIQQQ